MVGGCWSRLPALGSLRHTYIALRHGQSTANVAGIISSDPQVASVRSAGPLRRRHPELDL